MKNNENQTTLHENSSYSSYTKEINLLDFSNTYLQDNDFFCTYLPSVSKNNLEGKKLEKVSSTTEFENKLISYITQSNLKRKQNSKENRKNCNWKNVENIEKIRDVNGVKKREKLTSNKSKIIS